MSKDKRILGDDFAFIGKAGPLSKQSLVTKPHFSGKKHGTETKSEIQQSHSHLLVKTLKKNSVGSSAMEESDQTLRKNPWEHKTYLLEPGTHDRLRSVAYHDYEGVEINVLIRAIFDEFLKNKKSKPLPDRKKVEL